MAIRYQVMSLSNPKDPEAPAKYYLINRNVGKVDRDYLIKDMVRHTSLTYQEASTAIDYLFESVPRLLELGFTVQLGKLGYFRLSIRSKGSDLKEEATPDKIKSIHLNFIVGREIQKEINQYAVEKFPE